MAKKSKKLRAATKGLDLDAQHSLEDAVSMLKKLHVECGLIRPLRPCTTGAAEQPARQQATSDKNTANE